MAKNRPYPGSPLDVAYASGLLKDPDYERVRGLTPPPSSGHPRYMDEALRLLGSFARYVLRQAPHLSWELSQLALAWAKTEGIDPDKLMAALQDGE